VCRLKTGDKAGPCYETIISNDKVECQEKCFLLYTRMSHCRKRLTYTSQNINNVINSRKVRWTGHVALVVKMRKVYKILVGKPERKRSRGRYRLRW
jgi:hypothetical protein